ncbi:MAG: helix-turn-helix transcriptional regulator [Dehalococcoidia bacterium]|nr:helix-turn-helix transcriptional regulator [Dehalococcoidia bacterium]
MTRRDPAHDLTPRQREVLDLIARGLTNTEIAEELGISLSGVKWQVSEIIGRLGVAGRGEAAEYWLDRQSPAGRVRRLFGGLTLPVGAKALGLGTAAVGAIAVVAIAVPLVAATRDSGRDDATPAALASPSPVAPVFTAQEAEQRAQELARERVIDPSGFPEGPYELAVLSSGFAAGATDVESHVIGTTTRLGAPTDVWNVRLRIDMPGGSDGEVLIALEDGTGAMLAGGRVGEAAEWAKGTPAGPVLPMASATADGVTFTLAARWSGPEALPLLGRPGWCNRVEDSRYPGPGGGGCGLRHDPLPAGQHIALGSYGDLEGVAVTTGFISADVAHVRLVRVDGSPAFASIGDPPAGSGFPARMYIAATRSDQWFVRAEALDSHGVVLGAADIPPLTP